jgi:SOS-response transcriptional repressor LexA
MANKETQSPQKAAFERLIEVLREKNMKESAFYNSLTLENPTQTWNNWRIRGLPYREMPRVAEMLGLSHEWLAQGTGPKYKSVGAIEGQLEGVTGHFEAIPSPPEAKRVQSNVAAGPEIKGKIPLINYVQAGAWKEIMDHFEPLDWIETAANVSGKSFALRVIGDSMTNPYGAPSLPDGFIAIVDPEAPYSNGSIVVARLENTNEAMIKQLIIDGPHRYLKPLNPTYRTIEINENCVICGVVKRAQFDL